MFQGSNSKSEYKSRLYTGMTVFKVLSVNPSKDEIETMLSREYKLNVNYDRFELNGRMFRPIDIWVQDVNGLMDPIPIRYLLSLDNDVASTGSIRFVNSKGMFTYAKSEDELRGNPKMEWFSKHPFRPAKIGERELFVFMQKLMRYNNRDEEANFMDDAKDNNITIEKLYDNDLIGLRIFLDWCNKNDNHIVLIAAVRSTAKLVDGEPKTYYNQTLVNNPDFFFMTSTKEVSNKSFDTLRKEIDKGTRITKYMYTVEFQDFVKEECINAIPDSTVSVDPTSYI